jgi:hypothetical protein
MTEPVPATEDEVKADDDDDDEDEDEDDDNGEEYIVEAIQGHKLIRNQVFYNIKWKGYPESENTFEPEDNLLP